MTAPAVPAKRPLWGILRRDRPARLVSILNPGRRRSDRWVAYVIITLVILESLFVFATWIRQIQAGNDANRALTQQQEVNDEVQLQNRILVCYAQKTEAVEGATARYLIVQRQNPNSPETAEALSALQAAQADRQNCAATR